MKVLILLISSFWPFLANCNPYRPNGFAFNFPETRFCGSCNILQIWAEVLPVSHLDYLCKTFSMYRSDGWTFRHCIDWFLFELKEQEPEHYWIFYASYLTKVLYERPDVNGEEFTGRVFNVLDKDPNALSCVHTFTTGNFFELTPGLLENEWTRHLMHTQKVLIEGSQSLFAAKCNSTYHGEFMRAAEAKILKFRSEMTALEPILRDARSYTENFTPKDIFKDDFPHCPGNIGYSDILKNFSNCEQLFCYSPLVTLSKQTQDLQQCEVPLTNIITTPPTNPQQDTIESPLEENPTGSSVNEVESCSHEYDHDTDSPQSPIINEISAYSQSYSNREEFIEFKIRPVSSKPYRFTSSKLLFCRANSKICLVTVNMHNMVVKAGEQFFVLENNAEFEKYIKVASGPHKLVPSSENEPIVMFFLRKGKSAVESWQWEAINLKGTRGGSKSTVYSTLDISEPLTVKIKGENKVVDIWEIISKTIADMQIFGLQQNVDLSFYSEICKKFSGCNFLLNQGNPLFTYADVTLNYCPPEGPLSPFDYQHFKHAHSTKGRENKCDEGSYLTVAREHSRTGEIFTTEGAASQPSSSRQCTSIDKSVADTTSEIAFELQAIRENYNEDYDYPYFPNSKLAVIESFKKLVSSGHAYAESDLGDKLGPFKIVQSKAVPSSKSVICQICKDRADHAPHTFRLNELDAFGKEDGVAMTNKKFVQLVIEHLEKGSHYSSVLFELRQTRLQLGADARKKLNDLPISTSDLQQLENHMVASYGLVHMNTAVYNYGEFIRIIERTGGNVGPYLRSQQTGFKFLNFMGDEMTTSIIRYLMASGNPFCFLLDSTSDLKNHHVLIMYILTIEGTSTRTYFFGLKDMGKRFAASDYLEVITKAVGQYGTKFSHQFASQCVSLATDSENTMKTLHTMFEEWVHNMAPERAHKPIFNVYCLAHKINLASRSSLVPLKRDLDLGPDNVLLEYANLENMLNNFFTWFKVSGTRIGELNEQRSISSVRVELHKVYKNRWVTSEYITITNYLKNYTPVYQALNSLADINSKFPADVKTEAKKLLKQHTDKDVLFSFIGLQAYTFEFKIWSQTLQRTSSLLIDQYTPYFTLGENLSNLGKLSHSIIDNFLKECQCEGNAEIGCTYEQYESSKVVKWNGVELTSNIDFPRLSVILPALIEKTFKRLELYVPEKDLKNLRVFSADKIPSKEGLMLDYNGRYGLKEVRELAMDLGLPIEETVEAWSTLIADITESEHWADYRRVRPSSSFWARIMEDELIRFNEHSRRLIKTVLCFASGSTVCESGFSRFGMIKNKMRCSISTKNVEAILRVLLNGPRKLEDFNSLRYAQAWVQSKHYRPDQKTNFESCKDRAEEKEYSDLNEDLCVGDGFAEGGFAELEEVESDETVFESEKLVSSFLV